MSRARVSRWFIATVVVLGGCARSTPVDPVAARTTTVLLSQAPTTFDPRFVSESQGLKLTRLIFASLVTIDPYTLAVRNDLAERVEIESPTHYRVTLRAGLRFSDGSVLDSDDVVATFKGVASKTLGSRFAAGYQRIDHIDVIDKRSVVFVLKQPHAPFLTDLEMPIVRAEDAYRKLDVVSRAAWPVGAGAYKLTRASEGSYLLEANAFYYGATPSRRLLRFVVVRDENTRAMRLEAKKADLMLNALPPTLWPMFVGRSKTSRSVTLRASAGISTTYLGYNLRSDVLKQREVREAIAHAIDMRTLVETKFLGHAQLATSFMPTGHWASDTTLSAYDYDPERARSLLASVERHGQPIRLLYRTGADRFRLSIAHAIAYMLEQVGFQVDVRPSEFAALLADLDAGHFDITVLQIPELVEPQTLAWFFSSVVEATQTKKVNRWGYDNPLINQLFAEGTKLPTVDQRAPIYQRIERILHDDLPALPLWHEDNVAFVSQRLGGYRVPRDARYGNLAGDMHFGDTH